MYDQGNLMPSRFPFQYFSLNFEQSSVRILHKYMFKYITQRVCVTVLRKSFTLHRLFIRADKIKQVARAKRAL